MVELRKGDCVPAEFVVLREGIRCMDQQADGACVALDPVTHLCTIYESRPWVCRTFRRGGALCRLWLAPALAKAG